MGQQARRYADTAAMNAAHKTVRPPSLSPPTLSEIHALIEAAGGLNLKSLKITILRNVTVETIAPYLSYEGLVSGFSVDVTFGEFDTIAQDALAGDKGPLSHNPDIIVIWTFMETLSRKIAREFTSLAPAELEAEFAYIRDFVISTLVAIRRTSSAPIIWTGFEWPVQPAFGSADAQNPIGQTAMFGRLNQMLREQLAAIGGAIILDLTGSLARVGSDAFYDCRYWHLGRAPYGREGLRDIAAEIMKIARAAKGVGRKCLVLDADNTLWGGIVGEDGAANVFIGHEYPGSSYRDFQQEIVNLHDRGVLVAIASKNNPDDLWEVFNSRSEMLLKPEHIASAQVGWSNKIASLQTIAADLNIGLDSIVFVDDSPFECELVQQALPDVAVICLPADRPYEFRSILARCGLFDTFFVTAEDRNRSASYKSEAQRKKLREETKDIGHYLSSLGMVLEIERATTATVPRVAQLTQRTNQFTLTTRRYSEADILGFCDSNEAEVLIASLSDRFGDYGIIGAVVVKYAAAKGEIDSFMLSCRALGRGVEDALLDQALLAAKARGCSAMQGMYIPTAKNGQTANFFDRQGFALVESNDRKKLYSSDLQRFVARPLGPFNLVVSAIAQSAP